MAALRPEIVPPFEMPPLKIDTVPMLMPERPESVPAFEMPPEKVETELM